LIDPITNQGFIKQYSRCSKPENTKQLIHFKGNNQTECILHLLRRNFQIQVYGNRGGNLEKILLTSEKHYWLLEYKSEEIVPLGRSSLLPFPITSNLY
jgi:hypothetical protein